MSASQIDNSKVIGTSAIKTQLESSLTTENTGLELTVGNTTYKWNGTSFDTISLSGAGLVIQGFSGEGHVRRLNALNTTYARATNGANFTAVGGVKEVYITILPSAAGVAGDLSKEAILTYDAPSEAVASAFLADTGGQTTDVFQIALPLGVRNGPFFFTDPVNWFDIATDVAATALLEGVTP